MCPYLNCIKEQKMDNECYSKEKVGLSYSSVL